MTLSTAVFGGESPNDRISTILAVMTSISERVDKLVGKVGNMESKVNNIDHMEQLTAEKVSKMEDRIDSIDTKMDKVEQDVKMNGWMYLGRGYMIGGPVQESGTSGTTLSRCCQICEEKHSADHQWNGFIWRPSNGECWCEKNDKGNDPKRLQEYFMHFLKQ